MANTQYSMSRPTTALKTENFDMDSFFDFNQSTTQPSSANDAISPFDKEERQHYNGPSHDYHQYKQQVGLPVGSMANMTQPQMFDGYNSGIDMGMDGFGAGWGTGIDIDADMSMDFNNPQSSMPAMFFPESNSGANDSFVNPNTIGGQEEQTSSVGRLWPGMHSQQAQRAAMQKAQQGQAMQQRQMKLQAQQAHYRAPSSAPQSQAPQQAQPAAKRPSHITEPHVEESISRLLNQMRQQSSAGADADSPDDMLPHIARMKKDEEEMDEDERLLNSDEGKKLSSKERRQLRNKVSARAFRSRRKGKADLCILTAVRCPLIRSQNTSRNSKATWLSKHRKPPLSAKRTLSLCRRTTAIAA
jgi:bZIP-type transcription factor MBZ1